MAPVEVTTCAAVESTESLMERRYLHLDGPHARGFSSSPQITDLLGIAMAGSNGNRLMGFGFPPDQTIIWDGSAVQSS